MKKWKTFKRKKKHKTCEENFIETQNRTKKEEEKVSIISSTKSGNERKKVKTSI
jgi:hypothetical protein